jgi:hypothetical protein
VFARHWQTRTPGRFLTVTSEFTRGLQEFCYVDYVKHCVEISSSTTETFEFVSRDGTRFQNEASVLASKLLNLGTTQQCACFDQTKQTRQRVAIVSETVRSLHRYTFFSPPLFCNIPHSHFHNGKYTYHIVAVVYAEDSTVTGTKISMPLPTVQNVVSFFVVAVPHMSTCYLCYLVRTLFISIPSDDRLMKDMTLADPKCRTTPCKPGSRPKSPET